MIELESSVLEEPDEVFSILRSHMKLMGAPIVLVFLKWLIRLMRLAYMRLFDRLHVKLLLIFYQICWCGDLFC